MFEVNLPQVLAEVTAAFRSYEAALLANDIAALDRFFWDSPLAVRYGVTENLYGRDAIAAFRGARTLPANTRRLSDTVITTFGRDYATAHTLYQWQGSPRIGRQSQTWLRTEGGWRIVGAHVSYLEGASTELVQRAPE